MEDKIQELEATIASLKTRIKVLEEENRRLSSSKLDGESAPKTRRGKNNNVESRKPAKKRFVALKIMYIGSRYHGFASQGCSFKTVESEFFAALERTKLLLGSLADAKYSRCGRTDKGVSATAQVVALYLRSKKGDTEQTESQEDFPDDRVSAAKASREDEERFASTADDDEIDYVNTLNRVLPRDIRVLGWCPVPPGFSARFSCISREYKYFFIDNGLDINGMKEAAVKLTGQHDFRNFCKMDAENIHNYVREIHAFDILPVNDSFADRRLWVMVVRGNAFLWHQVRCMAAVLFMIGYGHELPTVIDDLLDVHKFSKKPQYLMASELPLVLRSCAFQGLSFSCRPEARKHTQRHLQELLDETLLSAAIISEGLKQIQFSGAQPKATQVHVPLTLRPTEPSYEERRQRLT